MKGNLDKNLLQKFNEQMGEANERELTEEEKEKKIIDALIEEDRAIENNHAMVHIEDGFLKQHEQYINAKMEAAQEEINKISREGGTVKPTTFWIARALKAQERDLKKIIAEARAKSDLK